MFRQLFQREASLLSALIEVVKIPMLEIANQDGAGQLMGLEGVGIPPGLLVGFLPILAQRFHLNEDMPFPEKVDIAIGTIAALDLFFKCRHAAAGNAKYLKKNHSGKIARPPLPSRHPCMSRQTGRRGRGFHSGSALRTCLPLTYHKAPASSRRKRQSPHGNIKRILSFPQSIFSPSLFSQKVQNTILCFPTGSANDIKIIGCWTKPSYIYEKVFTIRCGFFPDGELSLLSKRAHGGKAYRCSARD